MTINPLMPTIFEACSRLAPQTFWSLSRDAQSETLQAAAHHIQELRGDLTGFEAAQRLLGRIEGGQLSGNTMNNLALASVSTTVNELRRVLEAEALKEKAKRDPASQKGIEGAVFPKLAALPAVPAAAASSTKPQKRATKPGGMNYFSSALDTLKGKGLAAGDLLTEFPPELRSKIKARFVMAGKSSTVPSDCQEVLLPLFLQELSFARSRVEAGSHDAGSSSGLLRDALKLCACLSETVLRIRDQARHTHGAVAENILREVRSKAEEDLNALFEARDRGRIGVSLEAYLFKLQSVFPPVP